VPGGKIVATMRRHRFAPPRPARIVLALALVLTAASCSSTRSAAGEAAPAADAARRAAALDRKVGLQTERVEAAKAALASEEIAGRDAVAIAQAELEIARAELSRFDSTGAAVKLDGARLDLARAQDAHRESEEELQQLEMMYAEQDLADKTREIVLSRGRRSLERAAKALDISLRELAALESMGLPQERAKLALEADRKARELERARRAAVDALREKRIALLQAEGELLDARAEKDAAAAGTAGRE
jgi:hypothetical protein